MKKKYLSLFFLVLIYLASLLTTDESIKVMKNIFTKAEENVEDGKLVIVIDPGHGGRDPGKVGVNNILEKDINLSIALKLKSLLELNDFRVVMTREEDIGLYSETDRNKKNADLNKRIEIVHSCEADLAVSIHQNSYTEEYVRGAQVFYHKQSEEGKRLAEILQEQIKETLADGNHRKAKSNNDYYMLRKTQCPFVIVECGYLSNYQESGLLADEDYQEKLAWAIHLGIIRFINKEGLKKPQA